MPARLIVPAGVELLGTGAAAVHYTILASLANSNTIELVRVDQCCKEYTIQA